MKHVELEGCIVECTCGCSMIKFMYYPDEPLLSFEVYELGFYAHQGGKLKSYLKRLWSAICGKEYALYDVQITSEDAHFMCDWVICQLKHDSEYWISTDD